MRVRTKDVNSGIYEVITPIHVFQCEYGQIAIPAKRVVTIKGLEAFVDTVKFDARILRGCQGSLKRIG